MRGIRAIVFATALEILAEPLVLLVTLVLLALAALAPAAHYHQFGEPSRMARDAGLSALLVGVAVVAVFGAVRSIRREIESGTALSALAHPVSRAAFFLSKVGGVAVAATAVAASVGGVALTVVNGAVIGGVIAAQSNGFVRLWGGSLACAVAALVLPVLAAAALNRFFRFRFVLTANLLTLALALGGVAYRFDGAVVAQVLPVFLTAVQPAFFLLAVAAAFSMRFKVNAALSATALVGAAFLPALGSYCLSDVLSGGGSVAWSYPLASAAALAPLVAAALALGVHFFERRDVG